MRSSFKEPSLNMVTATYTGPLSVVKALLWDLGCRPGEIEVKVTNQSLAAVADLDLVVVDVRGGLDSGYVLSLSNEQSKVNKMAESLKQHFSTVPTPSQMRAAYKQAYGVEL